MINETTLYDLILQHKICFLVIRNSADETVFRSAEETNTPDSLLESVRTFFNTYPLTGVYSIEARQKSKTPATSALIWKLKAHKEMHESGNSKPTVIQGYTLDDVKSHIAEALKAHDEKTKLEKREQEYQDKRRELDAKIKEVEAWGGKLSIVGEMLVKNLISKSPALAGILAGTSGSGDAPANEELTSEEDKKVNDAVDRILDIFSVDEFVQISNALSKENKAMVLSFLK